MGGMGWFSLVIMDHSLIPCQAPVNHDHLMTAFLDPSRPHVLHDPGPDSSAAGPASCAGRRRGAGARAGPRGTLVKPVRKRGDFTVKKGLTWFNHEKNVVSPTKRVVSLWFKHRKYHQSLGFVSPKTIRRLIGSLQEPADIGRIDSLMKWRKW